MLSLKRPATAAILGFLVPAVLAQTEPGGTPTCANPSATCEAYGVDFQNGGSYFQNTASSEEFTFVSQFSGCANDVAQNILVDPSGTQYTCSNTSLTPDFTNELSTCDEAKANLSNGEWSLIIISNNGGCAPLAAQRSFSISAGPQATVTYTPTVTFTSTSTPVVTVTTTDTVTVTVTPAAGKRDARGFHIPRAAASTSTDTSTATTHTIYSSSFTAPSHSVVTSTPYCHVPPRASQADPLAKILPTVLGPAVQQVFSAATGLIARDAAPAPTAAPRLAEREARNARKLAKRAPDSPTVTVTDTNTADYVTSTTVTTASPLTTYTETSTTVTVTAEPAPASSAANNLGYTTITKTVSAFEWSTTFVVTVPTVTVNTTPTSAQASCHAQGGNLV